MMTIKSISTLNPFLTTKSEVLACFASIQVTFWLECIRVWVDTRVEVHPVNVYNMGRFGTGHHKVNRFSEKYKDTIKYKHEKPNNTKVLTGYDNHCIPRRKNYCAESQTTMAV